MVADTELFLLSARSATFNSLPVASRHWERGQELKKHACSCEQEDHLHLVLRDGFLYMVYKTLGFLEECNVKKGAQCLPLTKIRHWLRKDLVLYDALSMYVVKMFLTPRASLCAL